MRLAVIGTGISGIASAWLLSPMHTVDVYEAEPRLGGHTCTLDVDCGSGPFPVDTGFQVFNRRTYPNLTRFFERLGVDAVDADMSFSVQVKDADIEWNGTDLNTVFAERKNLVNPAFLRMLTEVLRFSWDAEKLMADPSVAEMTLGELLARERYSREFIEWYLVPMGAAIWSTPPGQMLEYPAMTFLHFCDTHGLLHVTGKPMWLSVPGGAKRYVSAAAKAFSGEVFVDEPVERIERTAAGVRLTTPRRTQDYDAVILATHPPETLDILGDSATREEREVLSAFGYRDNDIVVHTDGSFMPKSTRAWASWNYCCETSELNESQLVLTYQINTLQQVPQGSPTVFETLNPNRDLMPGCLLAQLSLAHPKFSRVAVEAQDKVSKIQGTGGVWYAGAWSRYGFHEDGILSAVRVCEAIGAGLPWGDELDPTRTLVRPGVRPPMLGQTRELQASEFPRTAEAEPAK